MQAQRKVRVKVPGKHFPGLVAAEQREMCWGTAVEAVERHNAQVCVAPQGVWGVAHTGPGIRFICESNAVDDPDHRGFWTTLPLWNRGRHEIYKDDRGPRRSDTSGRAAGGEGTGEPGGEQRQGAAGDKKVL